MPSQQIQKRNALIYKTRLQGKPYKAIGTTFGISPQRARQVFETMRYRVERGAQGLKKRI